MRTNERATWQADGPRGGVLVIADGPAGSAAYDAVTAVGARSLGCVGWDEACDRLDLQSAVEVVLAEAGQVDDALLGEVLPRLAFLAGAGDIRVVLTLDLEQIDLIAGTLGGQGIDLLCMPSPAERIAALSLAGVGYGRDQFHDVGHETEAVRLRRLHEEVARIAETLARLTRDEPVRRDDAGARGYHGSGLPQGAPSVEHASITPREIREAIRARRLRDQYFGTGLFEDPAWDMLLDLFAAELERAQVSVSSLCIAAAVAPTTALRWIARMTEAGLFERKPDPFDRRRAFMGLSAQASSGMRSYSVAVRRAGGRLA